MPDTPAMTSNTRLAAIAALLLSACGAHSFSLGGGTTTSSGSGSSGSSIPTSGGGNTVLVEPDDGITAATDRVNASTPNNAGRARSYPQGDYKDASYSYGKPEAQRGDGWFFEFRHRYLILAGYTVEEATRRAKDAGFAGPIHVIPDDNFDARCAAGTVCRIYPRLWQEFPNDQLTLYVNRSVQISSPD